MDCITAIKKRRSIRKFLDKPIPSDIIGKIIECGKYAPSAFDAQPWEFTVITDRLIIEELLSDRLQMKEFPYYINSRKYAEKMGIEKYQKMSTPPLVIAVSGNKKICPYLGSLITSISCCAENMMLAATVFGVGSCWLYVFDPDDVPETEEFVRSKLKLPNDYLVLCLLIFGYPNQRVDKKELRNIIINRISPTEH